MLKNFYQKYINFSKAMARIQKYFCIIHIIKKVKLTKMFYLSHF